jgi:hypothetical protein
MPDRRTTLLGSSTPLRWEQTNVAMDSSFRVGFQ